MDSVGVSKETVVKLIENLHTVWWSRINWSFLYSDNKGLTSERSVYSTSPQGVQIYNNFYNYLIIART